MTYANRAIMICVPLVGKASSMQEEAALFICICIAGQQNTVSVADMTEPALYCPQHFCKTMHLMDTAALSVE